MKKSGIIITTCLIIVALISCSIIPDEKVDHRIGTFKYADKLDDITIHRTEHKQYEYNSDSTQILIYDVKWINDEEFWLTFSHDIGYKGKKCLDPGDVIQSTITDIDKIGYTCNWTTENCGNGKSSFRKISNTPNKK
ncbi:MAG: hypothetical protein GQ574_03385 [Crocinitomix sp.]|nr:hypothetical protein [Crocinitomix sp.]